MKVVLDTFLRELNEKTIENDQYPVLTSSKAGIFLQNDYFNKQVASRDNTGYKVIRKGQFTYRAMSDTGEFFPNMLECTDIGIVSPAYPVFEIDKPDVIIPDFLKYYFKSDIFQHSIAAFAQGSTRTSIKFGKLKTVTINLPNLEQQKRTVEILDKVSRLIQDRIQELQQLDDLIKARFVEMFGRPALNDKKWEEYSLAEVCNKITDGEHKNPVFIDEGVPMVMANNVQDNGVTFEGCRFISEEDYKKFSKKCKPEKGDVLLVSRGATIGRCCENDTDKEFALMGSVILMKRKEMITSCYLVNWLKNDDIKPLIYTTSAASAQQAVYMKDLSIKRIMLPPVDLQNQFAEFVRQVDKSKVAVQKALDKTQLLFDNLMQQYFG